VNLTAVANGGSKSNIDIGIGWGYRTSGGFTALLVAEFFPIKQPRDYFIEKYKNNDQQYTINNEVQTSVDLNDESIFYNKVAFSIGFKLCYTFDIVKRFADATSN
jgi:hypothetical protein